MRSGAPRGKGPDKGGIDFLSVLGKLAVIYKHKLLSVALNSQLGKVHGTGAIHHIPVNRRWDESTREVEVLTGSGGDPVQSTLDVPFDQARAGKHTRSISRLSS
jgi:hypothetical protein